MMLCPVNDRAAPIIRTTSQVIPLSMRVPFLEITPYILCTKFSTAICNRSQGIVRVIVFDILSFRIDKFETAPTKILDFK